MSHASNEAYRQGVAAHAKELQAALARMSEPTSTFMRENFDLSIYPIGWTVGFAAKLEAFLTSQLTASTARREELEAALSALVEKWRKEADKGDENTRRSAGEGLKLITAMSSGIVTAIREKADELAAAFPLRDRILAVIEQHGELRALEIANILSPVRVDWSREGPYTDHVRAVRLELASMTRDGSVIETRTGTDVALQTPKGITYRLHAPLMTERDLTASTARREELEARVRGLELSRDMTDQATDEVIAGLERDLSASTARVQEVEAALEAQRRIYVRDNRQLREECVRQSKLLAASTASLEALTRQQVQEKKEEDKATRMDTRT